MFCLDWRRQIKTSKIYKGGYLQDYKKCPFIYDNLIIDALFKQKKHGIPIELEKSTQLLVLTTN